MEPESGGDDLTRLARTARARPRVARVRIGVGAAIVLLILALVVAVVVAMLAPHGGSQTIAPVSVHTRNSAGGSSAASSGAVAPQGGSELFVHVLGAVRHPGLFQLRDGARVMDAVAAAGGFSDTAEQSRVNLARKLADGEQMVVPSVGEVAPGNAADGSASGAADGAAAGSSGGGTAPAAKVNLNTADQSELETLPRVGPAMAQRIMDWRRANGRFATVEDLMAVTGIGERTFDALKDLVTV